MLRYALRRLGWMVIVLLGVALITFYISYVVPGDPARQVAGPAASAQTVASIHHQMGLDRPFVVQLGLYLGNLLHLNFGYSYVLRQPVLTLIWQRVPVTAAVALGGVLFELIIGLPVGIISALRRNSVLDRVTTLFALGGVSMPQFFLGKLLIFYLAFTFTIFPLSGLGDPVVWYLLLPCFTIGLTGAAWYARTMRSTMLEVMDQPYIRMARALGLSERQILLRYAIPNAIGPVVTMFGLDLGIFLGGVVIIEQVFGLPGIGLQALDAIHNLDTPLIMGTVLFAAIAIVLLNIIIDISYAFIDPRIRLR